MKKLLIYSILYLSYFISYSQLGPEDENFIVETEFETSNYHEKFYRDPGENVFTPISSYKGNVYFVWVDADFRPQVGQIKDGIVSTFFLDKDEDNPYVIIDDGHHKFSLGIDKNGYIHIVGDHRHYGAANEDLYVERYRGNQSLYWVSENPEDISTLEYRGADIEKAIPGNGFTYPSFQTDMNGELYLRHRGRVGNGGHYTGEMAWIASKYDIETEKWIELGGKTPDDFVGWFITPNIKYEALHKAIFWEDDGLGTAVRWYQGYAGASAFDFNNRWHVATSISNHESLSASSHLIYAYSDDGGSTFNKADGSSITELPMRVEEGPGQASIVTDIEEAPVGIHQATTITFDKEGAPMINYTRFKSNGPDGATYFNGNYKYWDINNNDWSEQKENPISSALRHVFVSDANGIINYISPHGDGIIREFGFNKEVGRKHINELRGNFHGFDHRGIREKNVVRGLLSSNGKLKVVSFKGIPNLRSIPEEWNTTSIGNATGESGIFHDIYQIQSTGIFNESLSGQYVNQSVEGDFELQARIINVDYVTDSSFAGLMIQDGDETNPSYFGIAATSHQGVKTISKDEVGFESTSLPGYEPSEWLRITKTGNLLEAFRSDNGTNWIKLDSREIEMNATVSYGLIAGSGNPTEMSHARIDHISLNNIEVVNCFNTTELIEAECFDDMSGIINDGTNIGGINSGDWVAYNNIDLTDISSVKVSAGTPTAGGIIEFRLGDIDGELIGSMEITTTRGWVDFETTEINTSRAEGEQDLYLVFTGTEHALFNIDWIIFSSQVACLNNPARIEAECYDDMSGIRLETSIEGGEHIGYIDSGDWVSYNNINLTGVNTVDVRMSSAKNGNNNFIEIRSGSIDGPIIGEVPILNTGGWQSLITETVSITETTGTHDIYLLFKGEAGGLANVNWFGFTNNSILSVNDNTENNNLILSLYPSPVDESVNINYPNFSGEEILQIIDTRGLVLMNEKLQGINSTIDVSNLESNLYFVKITNSKGEVAITKMLIK